MICGLSIVGGICAWNSREISKIRGNMNCRCHGVFIIILFSIISSEKFRYLFSILLKTVLFVFAIDPVLSSTSIVRYLQPW